MNRRQTLSFVSRAARRKIYDDEEGDLGSENFAGRSLSVFIRQSILAVIIKEHQLGCTCYQLPESIRETVRRLCRRNSRQLFTQERNLQMLEAGPVDRQLVINKIKTRTRWSVFYAYAFK